jgi:hypothetical protein
MVRAAIERRPERTLVAEVRGAQRPAERFVYSAHMQEPGANDCDYAEPVSHPVLTHAYD